MTTRLIFSGYAIFAAVSGATFLFLPAEAMSLYGVGQLDVVGTSLARGAGALLVTVAIVYWAARTARASQTRDGLLLGLIAVNAFSGMLAIDAAIVSGGHWFMWANAAFFMLVTMTVFVMARRAWSTRAYAHDAGSYPHC